MDDTSFHRLVAEVLRCGKGKKSRETAAFGEIVNLKGGHKGDKLEPVWRDALFLVKCWRAGEAIASADKRVRRAGTTRTVGRHRRWGAEGLRLPWAWNPDAGVAPGELRVHFLTESERLETLPKP